MKPLAAMLRLAPAGGLPKALPQRQIHPAEGTRRGRVALLQGCANRVLGAHVNEATIRVLNRQGIEVVTPQGETCCGALVHHMGREHQAHDQAKANIDAWTAEIDGAGLDAIVINVSGCGTTVKDYGFMLRNDEAYAEKASRVSGLTRDISEYLAALPQGAPAAPSGVTVAYHAACSLQHGQRVTRQPKELLARHGFRVVDIPEGHLCCGSAGTYNILQSEIAQTLRDRKIANIVRIESRRDRSRQYRMHHSDRVGHGDTGGPPDRVDRLVHGRPEAGGVVRRRACGAGQQGHGRGEDVSSCLEAV